MTDEKDNAVEPVAWLFELARSGWSRDTYGNWGPPQLSFSKPNVPKGSIRNLTPLYTRPSPQPAEKMALIEDRVQAMAHPSAPPKCAGCGRFIALADLERSRFEFEPLSEFGPEVAEWVCWRCLESEEPRHDR